MHLVHYSCLQLKSVSSTYAKCILDLGNIASVSVLLFVITVAVHGIVDPYLLYGRITA